MADTTQPTRSFGWWDMFVHPDDDPRADGGFENSERGMLVGYLRDRRLTLRLKCRDLDAEGLARRSVEPSNLSLLGLVRHLAEVERYWFREVMAGERTPEHFTGNAEFDDVTADPAMVEQAWALWQAEVEFAERFVETAPDLGVRGHDDDRTPLREVLVHMIEEYARHNGHADLLRERIDGRVGQ
ncbi:MAG TPA: DinB family protein [Amycolatopsis sp.]|uniref:DinB family protein n=1 Tax=Amycolatopsis nalaikhensis TaxID=715472 RepID=A0ABY8XCB3_9PSEU|nr:DinB family protein [Amycolatopsis sp. 2-2]WIV53650.1 DinB family protein [Amycolatopsis sp. 2-2]